MDLTTFLESFPDWARDTKLNLQAVLTAEGSPGLTISQSLGAALAVAYASKNEKVVEAVLSVAGGILSDGHRTATKGAAAIMAMNNVYYRTLHLIGNPDLNRMPAKLRMNFIRASGIEKVDFELYSLAVSVVNACSDCIRSHQNEVIKAGISMEGIQSIIRISSVMMSAAQVDFILSSSAA